MNTKALTLPLAALTTVALISSALAQPAFHLIGNPPGLISEVFSLSRDGRTAAGGSRMSDEISSFRWTLAAGREDFLPGTFSSGISADGSVVVGGLGIFSTNVQPFRRLSDGAVQSLGTLPGFMYGAGTAANFDGSTVIGNFYNSSGSVTKPFRWTASGGMQAMAGLGGSYTQARDISDDGKTVVGSYSPNSASGEHKAFIWNEVTGTHYLPGSIGDYGEAFACTPNTSVVVGRTSSPGGSGACRWDGDAVSLLGTVGDWRDSQANAVSDDGKVIVGQLFSSPTHVSWSTFIWTQETGMMQSVDYFKLMGVPLPGDLLGVTAWCVSGEGLTFGGSAAVPSAPDGGSGCIIHVPAPGMSMAIATSVCCLVRRHRSKRDQS